MNISNELNKHRRADEKAIVFGPVDGAIRHTDFPATKGSKVEHIGDVIDLKGEKEVMLFVSMTMRVPGSMAESECTFRGAKCRIRGIYLEELDGHVFLFIAQTPSS